MEGIQIEGIGLLKKEEKYQLNKIVNDYADKIERGIKNDFTIDLKLKEYETAGKKDKQHKYSISVTIKTSTKKLSADASDWDLNRTLHSVFKKILVEIEHKFRVSEQGRK